jgi:hypothetical protein
MLSAARATLALVSDPRTTKPTATKRLIEAALCKGKAVAALRR